MTEKEEQNDEIRAICEEVLSVIRAASYPDANVLIDSCKEVIYSRIDRKMAADSEPVKRNNPFALRSLLAACITVLIIIVASFSAYRYGKWSATTAEQTSEINKVEVTAPSGVISSFTLPDGTAVTINGGTRLSYPMTFGKTRRIDLTGEAYFDVAKDPERPFIVGIQDITVEALGTKFIVKAYDDDMQVRVTLEEGSVKTMLEGNKENILLKPAQQLEINRKTGEIKRRKVDTQEYTLWIEGVLEFRDVTLSEIAKTLERRFNIRIVIESDTVGAESYVARFKHGENHEQILDKLSYRRNWKYIKRDDLYEIVQLKQ
jgi:ferric-dicitrate binding protein FerR (iron transport regulator)